ncbi:acyltransferase [Methanobrevibacter sp.]
MSETKHIFYFDALRALAILFVILLHINGHLAEIVHYTVFNIYSIDGIYETFATNFYRIGVDLFLMLSGALLLGRDESVKSFYIKRIPRIARPFIFWSIVFSLMLFAASYFVPGMNFVSDFTVMGFVKIFLDTLTCQAPGSIVYWFFWMMLAVYILMPFVNKWINHVDLVNVEYFLVIWAIYNILVYTLMIPIPEIVSFIFSPLGFAVLGYYLRYSERKIFSSPIALWGFIIVPSIIMVIYSYTLIDIDLLFIFHRYSILLTLVAIGVFCLFKISDSINDIPQLLKNFISSVAFCSYGMYLIHGQIIMVVRKILPLSFNYSLIYLTLFICGFLLSWIIIYILAKIPIINEFIGVK